MYSLIIIAIFSNGTSMIEIENIQSHTNCEYIGTQLKDIGFANKWACICKK